MDRDVLQVGGPALAVLTGLSVVTWAVVLERCCFWMWWLLWRDRHGLSAAIDLIHGRRFTAATRTLERLKHMPTARVLGEGVRHSGEEAARYLEAAAIREHRAFLRHTGILDTVTTAAPLVGILGTVIGIIRSFQAFGGGSSGVPPPHRVIGGVSEALITTGAGLVVALIALVAAAGLRGLADRGTAGLEQIVTSVETTLTDGGGSDADRT